MFSTENVRSEFSWWLLPLCASASPEQRVSVQTQHPRVALAWAGRLSGPGARTGLGTLPHRALAGSSGCPEPCGLCSRWDGPAWLPSVCGEALKPGGWKGFACKAWLRRRAAMLPEQRAGPARRGQLMLPRTFFTLIHICPHVH